MRYKNLYLIDTLEIGGAEKSLLDILPRFEGIQPLLCQLYPGDTLKSAFEQAGIRVISLNLPHKYSFVRAIHQLRRIIRAEKPDLLHSTLFRANVVGRLAGWLEDVPVINTFVSDSYSVQRETPMSAGRLFKHRGLKLVDRLTAPLVTRFTANSHAVKAANCRALTVNPEKVQVIYRGRDVDLFFVPSPAEQGHCRAALKLEAQQSVIVNIGRLLPSKGQDDLLRALPAILERHPEACLLIAGEGPYRPVLERLIVDLGLSGRALLLGNRHDIPQLLRAADLFASPSHYEGLPGAVVEAMLTGLPVALSDMDVHREMVTDGENGRLFPLRDNVALSRTIIDLLAHPHEARRLGMCARQRAVALFQIDQVVAQHEDLYTEVLKEWRATHRPQ